VQGICSMLCGFWTSCKSRLIFNVCGRDYSQILVIARSALRRTGTGFCFVRMRRPHPHHYLIYTTPPPPSITLPHHLKWHTQNQADTLGFRFFWHWPLPPLCALKCAPPTTTITLPTPHHHTPPCKVIPPPKCSPPSHIIPSNQAPPLGFMRVFFLILFIQYIVVPSAVDLFLSQKA
jgi:hypothetical protein